MVQSGGVTRPDTVRVGNVASESPLFTSKGVGPNFLFPIPLPVSLNCGGHPNLLYRYNVLFYGKERTSVNDESGIDPGSPDLTKLEPVKDYALS